MFFKYTSELSPSLFHTFILIFFLRVQAFSFKLLINIKESVLETYLKIISPCHYKKRPHDTKSVSRFNYTQKKSI